MRSVHAVKKKETERQRERENRKKGLKELIVRPERAANWTGLGRQERAAKYKNVTVNRKISIDRASRDSEFSSLIVSLARIAANVRNFVRSFAGARCQ